MVNGLDKSENSAPAPGESGLSCPDSTKPYRINSKSIWRCAENLTAEYRKQYALSVQGAEMTMSGELLINEFYAVEKQIKLTLSAFEHIRMKNMPRLQCGEKAGQPRIYALADRYINLNEGAVNVNSITRFFEAYQQENILAAREIALLKDMLRFSMLEYMNECIIKISDDSLLAHRLRNILSGFKKLDALDTEAALASLNMADRILKTDEIYRAGDEATRRLYLNAAENLALKLHTDETTVAKTALMLAGKAKKEAEKSRRGKSENKAEESRKGKPEKETEAGPQKEAETNAENEKETEPDSGNNAEQDCRFYAGFYLIGKGAEETVYALNPQKRFFSRFYNERAERKKENEADTVKRKNRTNTENGCGTRHKSRENAKLAIFIAAQLLSAAVFLLPAARESVLSLIFALLPSLFTVNRIIVSLCTRIAKPGPLPRFSSDFGIKSENRTLVCVPLLITGEKALRSAAETLEMHFLANNIDNAEFALLADFRDSEAVKTENDEKLTLLGRKLISALNKKYPAESGNRFHYLQRSRVYNRHDGIFMGRERKRGAVKALIEMLLDGCYGDFNCVFPELSGKFKYLAVLDSDTVMPDGTLAKLICTAAHPMNRPVYDGGCRPVSGYSIIVPRMASTSRSAAESRFCTLISGDAGMSCYNVNASDFYQDIFGEGNFAGKGIIDIEAFALALKGKIPDNTVLSHDMLEGCFARAGFADDIVLYDSEPADFRSWHKRSHRWLRGDFQLLPFLFGKHGKTLSALSKYKILENIIRGIEPAAVFVSLAAALIFRKPVLCGYALTAFFIDPVLSFIGFIINSFREKTAVKPLILLIRRRLSEFSVLAYSAFNSADAAVRALYRTLFSHKKMLEWQTAADTRPKNGMRMRDYCLMLLPCLIAGAVSAGVFLFRAVSGIEQSVFLNVSACIISALWLTAPFTVRHLDGREKRENLSDSEKTELMQLFGCTWRYFEDNCNKKTAFLPPDNFQQEPYRGAAMLTSPTNIGMGLMAVVSAHDMGFIDGAGMVLRLKNMLASIGKAEKWNGHLFNWYSLPELAVLKPRFISTVDSGNLFVCLISAAQALKELGTDEADRLSDSAWKLASDMDFMCLYDKNRRLFHVGCEFDEGRLTESMYDLYASEARLTSFAAAAFSKVPSEHWLALSRLMCEADGGLVLKSWSGTMFEYLMPLLFLETVPGSMQHEVCSAAVLTQILSAGYKMPWGVSESGYYAFDKGLHYQYRAFGNPQLALAPAHEKEEVISAYASCLALAVKPREAVENLRLLREMGALGKYGMYEAMDFTHSRTGNGNFEIVRSFMAHHQGMSLCAVNNCLNDNILVKRFMALPAVRAHEQLLFENMPVNPIKLSAYESSVYNERASENGNGKEYSSFVRGFSDSSSLMLPDAQVLSNGNYTVFVSADGRGFSKRGNLLLTRSAEINGMEEGIDFIIKCADGCRRIAGNGIAEPHKITFEDRIGALKFRLEIFVSADFDCEIRRLTVINCGKKDAQAEIGIFACVALAERTEYESHPAFLRLNTEAERTDDSIIFRLRRTPQRKARFGFFNVLSHERPVLCTDGLVMPGRLNSRVSAMEIPARETDASQPVEPYFSARIKTQLSTGESAQILLTAGMADSREQALNVIREQRLRLDTAEALSKAYAQSVLRAFSMKPVTAVYAEKLAAFIFSDGIYKNGNDSVNILRGRKNLWKFGISGDRRFVLLCIRSVNERGKLKNYTDILRFLKHKGINFDLVVIGEYPHEYADPVRGMIEETIKNTENIILIHGYLITENEKAFLKAAALIAVNENEAFPCTLNIEKQFSEKIRERNGKGNAGAVLKQRLFAKMKNPAESSFQNMKPDFPYRSKKSGAPGSFDNPNSPGGLNGINNINGFGGLNGINNINNINNLNGFDNMNVLNALKKRAQEADFLPLRHKKLFDFNGFGGFDNVNTEYVIYIKGNAVTPLPWSNIIANEHFGTLVTESGGGYTWRINSRLFRLTPWTNDAVYDAKQEMIWVSYGSGAQRKTVPLTYTGSGEYEVRHGLGYTVFRCETAQAEFVLTETVDTVLPVKYYNVKITNRTLSSEKFTLTVKLNWLLGDFPFTSSVSIKKTAYGIETENLLSEYKENGFLALKSGGKLIETADGGITAEIFRQSDGNTEMTLLAGCDRRENIENDIRKADYGQHLKKLHRLNENRFARLKIHTGDGRFDSIVNKRLLCQVYSSRLLGKTGFYQSAGATGFRDQLQDVSALLITDPERAKEQIILCASKQFEKGDVLHWWHENGAGVRAFISDDRLFLPFTACEYAETTGDYEIFGKLCPYLKDIPIPEGQKDIYTEFTQEGAGTLYEHCKKAIDISCAYGAHGLPLMGGGDWNDAMDCVGRNGGESVFLAFFLILTIEKFIKICERMNDCRTAAEYARTAEKLRSNTEKYAWDGEKYIRAFFGDGAKLGGSGCTECETDCISGCFAVFAGAQHAGAAFDTVMNRLADSENGLIKLLDPPFSGLSRHDIGYIEGYLEGVRENGGQYTHAAVWCIIAACMLKRPETAAKLFRFANPAEHGGPERIMRYKAEPYAAAGDVYSGADGNGKISGRAGWSWYTGSAGWLYRAAVEFILGLKKRGDRLYIEPVTETENFTAEYRYGRNADTVYFIEAYKTGKKKLTQEGENCPCENGEAFIPLCDDGKKHHIRAEYE